MTRIPLGHGVFFCWGHRALNPPKQWGRLFPEAVHRQAGLTDRCAVPQGNPRRAGAQKCAALQAVLGIGFDALRRTGSETMGQPPFREANLRITSLPMHYALDLSWGLRLQ